MTPMRCIVSGLGLMLVLGGLCPAHASPLFELVGGFGGTGGMQPRHAGNSAAASYFNPALLPGVGSNVAAGILLLHTSVGITPGLRAPENAVPDGLALASHADGSVLSVVPIATDFLERGATSMESGLRARPRQRQGTGDETLSYEAIGMVANLFEGRLALGFHGLIPNKSFTRLRSFYPDEREQYFSNSLHPEMYGDRMTAVSMAVGAGVRATGELSFGLGATVDLVGDAKALAFVANAGKLSDVQVNTDVHARISLVPHGGVAFDRKRWHLTATVHAPQRVDVLAGFTFVLATGVEQSSDLAFTYFYKPWQAGGGLGYDFSVQGDRVWTASASFLFERWSKYIDRQSTRPSDAYAWGDTLTGAAGLRFRDGPLSIAVDGQYKPTPVPLQTGRTNYVDSDRIGLLVAMEYGFVMARTKVRLGGSLQLFRLLSREQTKLTPPNDPLGRTPTPQLVIDEVPDDAVSSDRPVPGREGLQTNNPGWPGFRSGGWAATAGLHVRVDL